MFEIKSQSRDFLKKIKDICFSTLKSYSFDKSEKIDQKQNPLHYETIECKDLVIQKTVKGNVVVITDGAKYLEGIKSLLSDSSKLMELTIHQVKWIKLHY